MQHLFEWVIKARKLILIFFLVAAVLGIVCKQLVGVDYDMNDYLPPESPSTIALDKMEAEYDGAIPDARVMLSQVTVPQAMAFKEQLEALNGVSSVTWLDDTGDVYVPLEMQDADTVETFYQSGNALFQVAVDEETRLETIAAIQEMIGDNGAITGSAAATAAATSSTVKEISKITGIAIAFVLLVLMLTTTSWAEPLIVLIGLGVAITINSGTNLMFGTISFVTNAAGTILQMAVSLDYSVFLIHRFEECRQEESDPKRAMVQALSKSFTSISSSGLTTVIGFLALCLMQFQIGPDMGLALAKGVALSLVTVFLFMPALILLAAPLLERTRHRPLMPSMRRFGRLVSRLMLPLSCVFAILIVPAYLASNANSYYYGASHIFESGTTYGDDTAKIVETFGKSDTYVLLVPKGDFATETKLSDELHTLPQVDGIISYVDNAGAAIPTEYLDSDTLSKLLSDHYSRMVISVSADYEGEETFSLIQSVRDIAQRYYPDSYYLAGEGVSTYDLKTTVTADMVKVNFLAIAAVFVVLLASMKSVTLPMILVLAIETAIWINLSIPYFCGKPVFYIAYLIISSIQLGATVDYAILFTDRYTEFRQSMTKQNAVAETISSVTVSILTSGSVLTVVGFLLGYISSHQLLSQLGFFLGKGTLCSLVIVLFVLPGLLYFFDGLIEKTTKGAHYFHPSKSGAEKAEKLPTSAGASAETLTKGEVS